MDMQGRRQKNFQEGATEKTRAGQRKGNGGATKTKRGKKTRGQRKTENSTIKPLSTLSVSSMILYQYHALSNPGGRVTPPLRLAADAHVGT